jgi:hypothetical protein
VQKAFTSLLAPGKDGTLRTTGDMLLPTPAAGSDREGTVIVRLEARGSAAALDVLRHPLHVWGPRARPEFVTAQDGAFRYRGKPWKVHGVNYMPSSGIGRDLPEDAGEFEFWLSRTAYDPEVIARDLDRVRALGLNAVSIFVYDRSADSGNLLDILRQCDERGLKVNLSLRPGTPIDWDEQWKAIRPIIERFRFARFDTIFAYDLAWEPGWGNHDARRRHDPEWAAWVTNRYGSVAAAERAWGVPAPRDGAGALTNPSDAQVSRDGPWRKLALDYRAFLNGLLSERYGRARRDVRALDPNHLVSFRMSETSDPTNSGAGGLPYDFSGLKDAVDFFAPEGYGRIGTTWEAVRPGWFQVAYARALNPALPLVWAEVGTSVWQPGEDAAPRAHLETQAQFFAQFYRMLKASGSNGVIFWWLPGGFRHGENSDFGVVNPDGTDRPASVVIRRNAVDFLASPAPVKTAPSAVVPIRLGERADGIFGIYETARPAFWQYVEKGLSPRLEIRSP